MSANPKFQIDRDDERRVLLKEMAYLKAALARAIEAEADQEKGYAYAYGLLQQAVKISVRLVEEDCGVTL